VLFALTLTILSSIIGVVAGAIQGFYGGRIDLFGQRFIEVWSGLPVLYLLIILASFVQPNFWWLLGIMLLFSWMALVDVVRAEFLRGRNLEYVRAARALGAGNGTIMFRHILPNAMVATLTFFPFILTGGVITLTSLDFLGFGLPPGSPSLGELIAQGKANLQAPWLGVTAFVVLSVMLSLLVFIGEALRDAFDSRKWHDRAIDTDRQPQCGLPHRARGNPGSTWRELRYPARADPGAGRRERFGKVGDRPLHPAPAALLPGPPPQWAHSLSGQGPAGDE